MPRNVSGGREFPHRPQGGVEVIAEDWVEYDRYNLFRQLGAEN